MGCLCLLGRMSWTKGTHWMLAGCVPREMELRQTFSSPPQLNSNLSAAAESGKIGYSHGRLARWGCILGVQLDLGSPLAPNQLSSPNE